MPTPPLLETRNLGKRFAAPVLKDIDFRLEAGEVHALMGSNGAGKSTLCNLIGGVHAPSGGELLLEGKRYSPSGIGDAERAGVFMVMQELNLLPNLSVAENLFFSRLPARCGFVDRPQLKRRARAALDRVGLHDLGPETAVAGLGVGTQQLIEIARVLERAPRLLILDEPTAALTDPEIETLFLRVRDLRAAGVGIVYISHRMDEVAAIADRVTVLRDGMLVASDATAALDEAAILQAMAGPAAVAPGAVQMPARAPRRPALRARGLRRSGALADVDLELHHGEVLGIGGLIGAGRSELLRALFGADPLEAGAIYVAADDFTVPRRPRSPTEAVALGIGLVVEDRKQQGLFLDRPVIENGLISVLAGLARWRSWRDGGAESEAFAAQARDLEIRLSDVRQPVRELSGGNQQKVLIARWRLRHLPILLFDEPTRGVDAHAKARIQQLIRSAAQRGQAVAVVSSETDELLRLSDRILVLSAGRVADSFDIAEATEERILSASFRYMRRAPVSSEAGGQR